MASRRKGILTHVGQRAAGFGVVLVTGLYLGAEQNGRRCEIVAVDEAEITLGDGVSHSLPR